MKMKINVKSLKVPNLELEVDSDDTVDIVKQIIEDVLGSDYPKERQALIFKRNILRNGMTLDKANVTNNDSILVVNRSSPGESSTSTNTITTEVPVTGGQPLSNTSQASFALTAPTLASAAPTPVLAPDPSTTPPSVWDGHGQEPLDLIMEIEREDAVQSILDMGDGTWDRDIVARMFDYVINDPSIPIEYLLGGEPPVRPSPAANPPAPSPVPSSGPNTIPLNLFPQDMNTGSSNTRPFLPLAELVDNPEVSISLPLAELVDNPEFLTLCTWVQNHPDTLEPLVQFIAMVNRRLYSLIRAHSRVFHILMAAPEYRPTQSDPNLLSGPLDQVNSAVVESNIVTPKDSPAVDRAIPDTGSSNTRLSLSLDEIRNSPEYQAVIARIQANPEELQTLLEEIEQEDPIFFNQIQTRPIHLLGLLGETEQDGVRVPSEEVVSAFLQSNIVTPEDRVTIDQLVALGFHRSVVVKIYYYLFRNEHLALMYLALKE